MTRANRTRPVMGARNTPTSRMVRSRTNNQNSFNIFLQHPFDLGAAGLLKSKPERVRTMSMGSGALLAALLVLCSAGALLCWCSALLPEVLEDECEA